MGSSFKCLIFNDFHKITLIKEMNRPLNHSEDRVDLQIQQNVTNWQAVKNPLAPLTEEQLDVIYQISDVIKANFTNNEEQQQTNDKIDEHFPEIDTYQAFIKWLISVENRVKSENFKEYRNYHQKLCQHSNNCQELFQYADDTTKLLEELRQKYMQVTAKTDSLHNLSEQLMAQQRVLKEKKRNLNEKLRYFLMFNSIQDNIDRYSTKINCQQFIDILNDIDNAIVYLGEHMNFKESRIYKMKYESLLVSALNKIYRIVSNVITDATKQVIDPESKTNLLPLNSMLTTNDNQTDSIFSLYYGRFQRAAARVKLILTHLEDKSQQNEQYRNIVTDCQKFYVSQRLPILNTAVSKALSELKECHKNDYSTLFRSCGLFLLKTCQDEASCYHYFFTDYSPELDDFLASLCQNLYDTLRPSLILINHVEVLSELCRILQKEMLNDKIINNDHLQKYVDIIRQLLQDAAERLVFRTNIFFQHDLLGYNPSPGDLAYPEKLEQIENIALELQDIRADSRASVTSLESQEVASINSSQFSQFRSYTGNSPADLHGMWYPTVKRTLVILSRLYFCLDRETFQGLAQEALLICIKTIEYAANLISTRKTQLDGYLFQIKHLLIIREQIAPFQVDFTVKETALDFSNVQKAAIDLIHNRDKLFKFGTNNALLEFLLEGTPRVREYLVDSRKEIDKQLKQSCENFIMTTTNLLTGNLQQWMTKAERYLYAMTNIENPIILPQQEFGKAKYLSDLMNETIRNLKIKIPEIQRSMQLYLANRETEFILFRPIKNNVVNVFVQMEQTLISAKYTNEELIMIGCPSPEQINVLICSVSLSSEQEMSKPKS